jgi:hypothetical protein
MLAPKHPCLGRLLTAVAEVLARRARLFLASKGLRAAALAMPGWEVTCKGVHLSSLAACLAKVPHTGLVDSVTSAVQRGPPVWASYLRLCTAWPSWNRGGCFWMDTSSNSVQRAP